MTEDAPIAQPEGPGRSHVGVLGIAVTVLSLVLIGLFLLYALIAIWPAGGQVEAAPVRQFLGHSVSIGRDQVLFILVSVAGALGGIIHSLRSLYWYIGNRQLRRSWLAMYALIPVIGACLAVVFYVVLRGGLLSGQAASSDVNAYGFTAVASLVGLFSPEAMLKLKQIFGSIFTVPETGRDSVPEESKPPSKD